MRINRLQWVADDSHEISYLIFFRKLEKMPQNLSSAAVVIGILSIEANSIDPEHTAPIGAVWSGSTLFAIEAS